MWWKRAFIILFGINLLICAAGLIAWNALPNHAPSQTVSPAKTPAGAPSVDVVIGQDAVNAYLAYAIQQEADLRQIVEGAHVQFATNWDCDFYIDVLGKAMPFHLTITPLIENGNMLLHVEKASMASIPIPNPILFSLLGRARWPNWIQTDAGHDNLDINFTSRPQQPFGVRAVQYSPETQQLTMQITISPNTLMKSTNS
ncbi:DUF2140 family protein [Alicyclobacillus acidiphilus]|uniref:DUF2140 family protein n=1 Tax=Alicyclobacillus acidiphilus TaxID=182455 RepID=UPI00082D7A8C|nr:DUF2140 family protein [Alicyclobacillus acidiphilus]